ncbi:MAG TPA: CoA transferase, partial [Actinobacteria bacterium]|nr:CoA transferase [Actinomycetota bacterium]
SAGVILADLGADVIKVEPPGGDHLRGMLRPPKVEGDAASIDYPFTTANRGKRSIVIAVNEPDGADLVRRLVATADVFLTNMLPHRQERYGFGPEALAAANPSLVHASLSGYGLTGPDAAAPGYDVTAFFARAGITDAITLPGADAPMPGAAQGDHVAGLAMVGSILAALRVAEKTGEAQTVDVSLFASGVWTMASDLSSVLVDRRQPAKRRRDEMVSAMNNRYRCADDRWVFLTMPGQHWWAKFCAAVGLDDLIADPRFFDGKIRYRNMAELVAIIDAVFVTKPLAEWAVILDEAGLIWGPAARLIDVIDDPQAEAIGLFPTIEHEVAGTFRTVASPVGVASADSRPFGPAPAAGDHTDEVLQGLGLNAAEITRLRESDIVQ